MSFAVLLRGRSAAAGAVAVAVALVAAAPAAPSAAHARTVRAAAKCTTAGLVVWLDTAGNAAAGSTYFTLKFTNLSGRTCTLVGYPGVSGVDLAGHQLGSAGSRNPSNVGVVTLAPGATANAVLRITVAGNFPPSICHRVSAAGVRVFPPNQRASKIVPLPFDACSKAGPVYLSVKAVTT